MAVQPARPRRSVDEVHRHLEVEAFEELGVLGVGQHDGAVGVPDVASEPRPGVGLIPTTTRPLSAAPPRRNTYSGTLSRNTPTCRPNTPRSSCAARVQLSCTTSAQDHCRSPVSSPGLGSDARSTRSPRWCQPRQPEDALGDDVALDLRGTAEIVLAKEMKYCSSQVPWGSSMARCPSRATTPVSRASAWRLCGDQRQVLPPRSRTASSTPARGRCRRGPAWRSRDSRGSGCLGVDRHLHDLVDGEGLLGRREPPRSGGASRAGARVTHPGPSPPTQTMPRSWASEPLAIAQPSFSVPTRFAIGSGRRRGRPR